MIGRNKGGSPIDFKEFHRKQAFGTFIHKMKRLQERDESNVGERVEMRKIFTK